MTDEKTILKALEASSKSGGCENLKELSEFYYNNGQFNRAVPPLQRLLKVAEDNFAPERDVVAPNLYNLASVYKVQKNTKRQNRFFCEL